MCPIPNRGVCARVAGRRGKHPCLDDPDWIRHESRQDSYTFESESVGIDLNIRRAANQRSQTQGSSHNMKALIHLHDV